MTRGDWLHKHRRLLPKGEALLILASVLREEKTALLAHPEYPLSPTEEMLLKKFVARRKNHEPLAYITGEKEFFGLSFFVTPDTLIPRPETEILVEHVLDKISDTKYKIFREGISVIDIGTGSGCIPISIGKTLQSRHPDIFSRTKITAVDISPRALSIARKNAKRHGIDHDILFQTSDLLSGIGTDSFHSPSIILTANLPYLSKTIYDATPKEVRNYEPTNALQGDMFDGTSLIKKLLEQYLARNFQTQKPFLILEISPEQSLSLVKYSRKLFPQLHTHIIADLSGKDRLLLIENHSPIS